MRSAPYLAPQDRKSAPAARLAALALWWRAPAIGRAPVTRRALAFVLVVIIHILLALALLLITPKRPPKFGDPASVFTLLPDRAPAPTPAPKPAAKPIPKQPITAPKAPRPEVVVKSPPTPDSKPFTVQLFDAIDIAKIPNRKAEQAQAETNDASTADASSIGDSTFVEGGGPHGERLYNAEWQREPTDAELAYYLPKTGVPSGSYALIACRTVARFKVEDCVEQGEGPRGSGLARHIVEAAWQFRVLPPRVGGKSLVGTWVRILISFSDGGSESGNGPKTRREPEANLTPRPNRSGPNTYGPSQ